MKKAILLMLSLLVIALLVVSCAPKEVSEDTSDDAALAGQAVSTSTTVVKGDIVLLGGVVLEYKGADRTTVTNPKIKFKDWYSGETVELAILNNAATIRVGEREFKLLLVTPTRDDSALKIDFTGDGVADAPLVKSMKYKDTGITCQEASPCLAEDTLLVGEARDYTVQGTQYQISLRRMGMSDAGVVSANFSISSEDWSEIFGLMEGETYNFAEDNIITLTDLLYQAYAGGVQSATFCIK